MARRELTARAFNELSLGAWFGGSLMGAVGLRRAAATATSRHAAESAGWSAWQPIQTAAIVSQIVSGAAMTWGNKGRIAGQQGVATASLVRTGVLAASGLATVLAARSGRRAAEAAKSGDTAGAEAAERRNRALQWVVPSLTGTLLVIDAFMGEQQRANQVTTGMVQRLLPDRLVELLD